jgi:endonuclease/exonuclease/phosphatase family metal-dependent hydrolase
MEDVMKAAVDIISWNIQWGRGADGRVDLDRCAAAIRTLGGAAGADLICLQEVACRFPGLAGGAGEDEPAFFRAAFPDYQAFYAAGVDVPDGQGGRAQFGNLLLSRLAVDQVFRHLLPWPADPGFPAMQRVCLEAVVQAPWGWLRVLTTHLEYYSQRQRSAQVEALRGLQREAAEHAATAATGRESNPTFAARPRPAEAVLCGDFNCEPESAEHAALRAPNGIAAAAWMDAWALAHGAQAHAPTVGLHGAEWPQRAYCCDYFFVSAPLAARVAGVAVDASTAASDHQPLCLQLSAH